MLRERPLDLARPGFERPEPPDRRTPPRKNLVRTGILPHSRAGLPGWISRGEVIRKGTVSRLRAFSVKPSSDYLWLRSIRRYWILPAEMVSTVLLFIGLFIAVALPLFGARQIVPQTLGAFLIASFATHFIQYFLFYRAIRCPICVYNPTRYKNGKNIPTKTAWKRLEVMESCPACNGKSE